MISNIRHPSAKISVVVVFWLKVELAVYWLVDLPSDVRILTRHILSGIEIHKHMHGVVQLRSVCCRSG